MIQDLTAQLKQSCDGLWPSMSHIPPFNQSRCIGGMVGYDWPDLSHAPIFGWWQGTMIDSYHENHVLSWREDIPQGKKYYKERWEWGWEVKADSP